MANFSSQPQVIANLVIGANGATEAMGSSRGLTTKLDRERFHQLRERAQAICIGGATFRSEPYEKTPLPLYVASTNAQSHSATSIHFHKLSPLQLVELALRSEGAPVLIEGGIKFLEGLIDTGKIDEFHITRSPKHGDGSFFDEDNLNRNYRCLVSDEVDGTKFEIWFPLNR